MSAKSRFVAVIPARSGSKRLPGKNLKKLRGKPLINWSVEAALSSKRLDDVVVTTDSYEIANESRAAGASVPFIRSAELAADDTSSFDVVLDVVRRLELGDNDVVVLLQPTSPLRNSEDIDNAIQLLDAHSLEGVVSVVECEHSPLWANTLRSDLRMVDFIRPEVLGKRSQSLDPYYRLNGAIYIYRVAPLLRNGGVYYNSAVMAYVMPAERSVDIDTKFDFVVASSLLCEREQSEF